MLVEFNYDNPNAKVVGTGVFVVIDQVPDPVTGALVPLYLELIGPIPTSRRSRVALLATG